MIICPICEHPQAQGSECDVCGKRLVAGVSAADLAIAAVDGLEPTLHLPADAVEERIPDLEPTLRGAGDAVFADDRTPDLEPTRTEPVDVDAPETPDVERTAVAGLPDDGPTLLPEVVLCRYCRTPASPGDWLCARCGVRLPVIPLATADAAALLRVCSCGTSVRPDASLCPNCGARLS
ncbi:MAG TPA: zinc ribbon domain-containing protein [Anaeromyxobacter sp.]